MSLSGRVEVAEQCFKELNSVNIFLRGLLCNRPHGREDGESKKLSHILSNGDDNSSAYKVLQYITEGCVL